MPPKIDEETRDEILKRREERRDDIRDDHWDRYNDHYYRVGTVYRYDEFDTDYCEASVTLGDVTYYQCDSVWFKRVYSGGAVNYVVVEAPERD